jgi:GDP/UDP-N,N'-diacetylbacillosamine 2-epimerase (hydrolysing)
MLVVLGDRYELLAACECAMIYRIPIAHIHGGELTHGAIDDMVRHSITKMSSLHFTSTEKYRQRVIQMGEHPDTVFNTGAPGLENARHLTILSKSTLTERFGIKWKKPVVLVTFHPVTLENSTSADQFGSLLYVIDHHKEFEYIFTYANADTDGHVINQMIDQYCSNHDNCIQVKSMGQQGYLSTLSYAFFVIGNSSSGLIEVPSFHIPTINIGDRQGGRIRADSVIDCSNDEAAIEKAVQKASSEEFRNKCQKTINPYEGADTSHRIVEEIKKYLETHHSTSKDFYDLIS